MSEFYVVSFNSTHQAIRAEKILEEAGIDIVTMPTPRGITASCGLSIRFDFQKIDEVVKLMNESGVERRGIYKIFKKGENREAEFITE